MKGPHELNCIQSNTMCWLYGEPLYKIEIDEMTDI